MIRRRVALPAACLLVAATLGALAGCSGDSGSKLGPHGEIAPDGERAGARSLTAPRLGGGTVDLASMRGKVVVLNVFGSWCDPCKEETPGLVQSATDTQGKGLPVQFVGLAERDTTGGIDQFTATYGVTWPVVNDDEGSIVAGLGTLAPAVPSTLVLDKQGRPAAHFIGQAIGRELTTVVTALAAEPAPA